MEISRRKVKRNAVTSDRMKTYLAVIIFLLPSLLSALSIWQAPLSGSDAVLSSVVSPLTRTYETGRSDRFQTIVINEIMADPGFDFNDDGTAD